MRRLLLILCAGIAVAAPKGPPLVKGPVTRIELREVAAPHAVLVAKGRRVVLVSPDGKTLLAIDRARNAYAIGKTEKLSRDSIDMYASAFGPDSKSVLLAGVLGGVRVVSVPEHRTVFDSVDAADAFYQDATTILFRQGAIPTKLDLATGKTSALGKALPDFGCTNLPAFRDNWRDGKGCASRTWGHVHGVDKTGRWLIEDYASATSAWRFRSIDPATGNTKVMFETSRTTGFTTALSPDREFVCFLLVNAPKDYESRCGRLSGPYYSVSHGSEHRAFVSLFSDGRVVISDVEKGHFAPRIVDLKTGAITHLGLGGSGHVTQPNGKIFAHDGKSHFVIDVDARTMTRVPDEHSILGADPTNPRRIFTYRGEGSEYDTYRVDLP